MKTDTVSPTPFDTSDVVLLHDGTEFVAGWVDKYEFVEAVAHERGADDDLIDAIAHAELDQTHLIAIETGGEWQIRKAAENEPGAFAATVWWDNQRLVANYFQEASDALRQDPAFDHDERLQCEADALAVLAQQSLGHGEHYPSAMANTIVGHNGNVLLGKHARQMIAQYVASPSLFEIVDLFEAMRRMHQHEAARRDAVFELESIGETTWHDDAVEPTSSVLAALARNQFDH